MKGKTALAAGLMVLSAGCAEVMDSAYYGSTLTKVDRPEETTKRYGPAGVIKRQVGRKYLYEDGLVSGMFSTTSRINFSITNNTDHLMKIVWKDAKFIFADDETGRLQHRRIKLVDGKSSLPPSLIHGGTTLIGDTTFAKEFRAELRQNDDKRFGLVVPIESDGIINEYMFWFEAKDVSHGQQQERLAAKYPGGAHP